MHTQRANRGLIVIVTIAVPLLAAMLIAYMLLTAEHPLSVEAEAVQSSSEFARDGALQLAIHRSPLKAKPATKARRNPKALRLVCRLGSFM
jgi:hypothetical protein